MQKNFLVFGGFHFNRHDDLTPFGEFNGIAKNVDKDLAQSSGVPHKHAGDFRTYPPIREAF
jgi:hypothetical protein